MFRLRKLLAALCLLLSLTGCGGSGDSPLVQAEGALRTRVTASLNSALRIVTLSVTVTNTSRSTVTLGSSKAAIYEVEVDDSGGKRVWNYGLVNIAQPTQVSLAPGQVQTFTLTWYAENSQGISVKTGTYRVTAVLVPQTVNGAVVSAPLQSALPAAATVVLSTSGDLINLKGFEPGVVLLGMKPDQDTMANRNLLVTAGSYSYDMELHDGVMTLKPGISTEAAIAFFQTLPFVRYAERNGYAEVNSAD